MTDPPRASPAAAGVTLLTMIVLGAGVGAGLGALTGWLAPLVLIGTVAGFAGGIALVYTRYKDL
ncbi:MAG: hypothetical protein QOG62_2035 [Thermoleophilaceae bacterium]|jgi:uncharacterized membrane protein|nr:hypothetical protein [Thermoleophilaceae bacterium]